MRKYRQKLGLKYDPFDGELRPDVFFGGGNRDYLVNALLDGERGDIVLDTVIGPSGSGKTRLASRLRECAGGDIQPVLVAVGLLTTADDLLRDVLLELGLEPSADVGSGLQSLNRYAIALRQAGKSVLLLIDNAHELAPDCVKLVGRLLANRWSAIHPALFGEDPLRDMLAAGLRAGHLNKTAFHELPPFDRVETVQYIQLKLFRAGYRGELRLSSQAGLDLLRRCEGIPGAIERLAAALLDSDAPPTDELARARAASGPRPELRYLWHAFAFGLALAAVLFMWPAEPPDSLAASETVAPETQRISLPAASRPAPEYAGRGQRRSAATQSIPAEATGGAPSLTEFELWLLDAPPDYFTVQILGSTSEQDVREFIASAALGENHGYYETRRERAPWFVVVEGVYAEWESAMEARTRLAATLVDSQPEPRPELNPWIRRLSNVHTGIDRAGKGAQPGARPN